MSPIRKHILLVESDSTVQRPLFEELQRVNFTVSQADSGERALKILLESCDSEQPVDLLATEVRLKGMTGVELVDAMHSAGIEIPVLPFSDYFTEAVKAAFYRKGGCVGFLLKPFSLAQFSERIRTVLAHPDPLELAREMRRKDEASPPQAVLSPEKQALDDQLHLLNYLAVFSAELNSMLADPNLVLPSLPEVVCRLRKVLQNPNVTFEDVAAVANQDPAMAARLLQVANSPIYAGHKRAKNLKDAVARLGLGEVVNILQAVAMKSLFQSANPRINEILEQLWVHSICTAYANEIVANMLEMPNSQDFFMMGLLHDIGKLLILHLVRQGEESDRWKEGEITDAILKPFFAMRHQDLGARLLENWQYPKTFLEVVRLHDDEKNFYRQQEPIIVTYFTNLITRKLGFSLVEYAGSPLDDVRLISALNLTTEKRDEIENTLRDVAARILKSSLA